jgi:DNA adenine methylase
MKPIISYYGGKQRLAPKIIKLIPKHTVYAEPFAGGLAVMFKKPWPEVTNTHHYREIINDIDERLTNLYRMFQIKPKKLVHLLENTMYNESEFLKSRDILNGKIKANDLWKAWAYYVNINQGFSNVLLRGWRRSVFGVNGGGSWSGKIKNLSQYKERMSEVIVACTDAIKFIKQYDSPQTFFYCDPPYVGSNQGHYKGYTVEDFRLLIDALSNIQGSFLLSTYKVDGVKIPKNIKGFRVKSYCSASQKGKVNIDRTKKATKEELGDTQRTELLYRKFSVEPREEIKKLYASGKFDCFLSHPWEDNDDRQR